MAVCGRGQFRVHRSRLPIDLPTVKKGNGSNLTTGKGARGSTNCVVSVPRLPLILFPFSPSQFDPVRRAQFSRLSFLLARASAIRARRGVHCSPANKHFFRSAFAEEKRRKREGNGGAAKFPKDRRSEHASERLSEGGRRTTWDRDKAAFVPHASPPRLFGFHSAEMGDESEACVFKPKDRISHLRRPIEFR